jgi:hypothetical protein
MNRYQRAMEPPHQEKTMRISTNDLTWDKKTLTFTGWSDLFDEILDEDPDCELDDALLTGDKVLFNPKTGDESVFTYDNTIWEEEPNHPVGPWLAGWKYTCSRPGLPDLFLIIKND